VLGRIDNDLVRAEPRMTLEQAVMVLMRCFDLDRLVEVGYDARFPARFVGEPFFFPDRENLRRRQRFVAFAEGAFFYVP
jgi:hypothetical protein